MRKNIDIFNELDINTKDKVYEEIDKYLQEATYSLPTLSEEINSLTGMTTNRKSISKLLLDLGYESKSSDLVKLSKIKNAEKDLQLKAEKQLKEKEKELLKIQSKEVLIKTYHDGKSILKIEKETGISVYYLNMIFEKWNVQLRPLPKTNKEIIAELSEKGYDKQKLIEEYHGNNLTMEEFVNFMSSIINYPITIRMGERIVKSENLHKPAYKAKENRGKKTRTEFDRTIANVNAAGFNNFQELADFFYKNKHLTYEDMAKLLNKNVKEDDRKFNVRWLERHVMPLLPDDRLIGVSRLELSVKSYISTLIPENEFECSNRTILKPFELDFVFSSRNLAIEVNGLYWHSEKFGKDNNYHYDKWKKCRDQGIQLLTIWEDDWRDNRKIVEKVIAHKLGVSTDKQIGARKTYVDRNVSFDDASLLLNHNHIQGEAVGSHYIGLRSKETEELVAVMVLQKTKSDVESFDLVRYATNCIVAGGFTKLLNFVEKELKAQEITTFSDNEISDGNLYSSHGFIDVKELKPDYKYVYHLTRKHKFLFRKERFKNNPDLLFEEDLTERELAELNGLYRVYDSGKVKWVKKFND